MVSSDLITALDKLDILDDIKEVFYKNTGLIISFYYSNDGKYDFYPKFKKNEYCMALQSTEEGLKKCLESDNSALEKAKRTKQYCLYTCHAGLTNVVIPLEYKGVEIGSIFSGQIVTEKPTVEMFNKIFNKIKCPGIEYEVLLKSFLNTKLMKEEDLLFGIKLLEVMANYIISVEDENFLQSEIYIKDKEILEYENKEIKLENELKKLQISILEYDKENKEILAKSNGSKNTHVISKAQLFIQDNYYKNIKLNDVADAVYLSPNYFSTIFKEITGYNFCVYLSKTRIKKAKKLLLETELPIKEIVFKTGFEDYNYFNRIFKQTEGIPPAKFRSIAKSNCIENRKIIQKVRMNI